MIALGFMFFAGIAMTVGEGLWSNTISLLFVLISGLAGATAGVPLGILIMEQMDQADANAWYFIFAGMWAAFVLTMLLLRIVAEKASKTRVRFLPIVDKLGGIAMGLLVAVMLTSFAAFTLWSAPIKADADWSKDARKPTFAKAVGPFNFVLQRFLDAEKLDSPFYK